MKGPESKRRDPSSEGATVSALPLAEQGLIREFTQALAEEIEAIKRGRGGSIITVYDGSFVRREGPFFVYIFTTESPLIVMDDAPAEVEVNGQRFAGQVISVQGSAVAVGIEHDFGRSISEARLITNLWYLLDALRKRYEEVLAGKRALETNLAQRLFGLAPASVQADDGDLNLPPSAVPLNREQLAAIRATCGSDIHFVWGPPGTGKTETIGFLIAALVRRNLRVLIVSHTNVATDHAIAKAAKLLADTKDYQSGKLVRYGNIVPHSQLPDKFPMVIPEKIAEVLGEHLRARRHHLQEDLELVQSTLASLRNIESSLTREAQARRRIGELQTELDRCADEHERTRSRADALRQSIDEVEQKLVRAQNAGKVKRFVLGLDPAKLDSRLAQLRSELAGLNRAIAAGALKLHEFEVSIDKATAEADRCANEARVLFSRHGLNAAGLGGHIRELTAHVEELTAAIRAVDAELEALLAKILREAKVIATSLTKATISKQMDDQRFDVVVVDEASMAPMPSLYFATSRATRKAIVVGDFRQLPPIVLAETEMATKWLGRDIFTQSGIQRAVDEGRQEPRLTMLRRQYRMHPHISRTANEIIYGGQLVDCLSSEAVEEIRACLERSPFVEGPSALMNGSLLLYDVSSVNPWSSRLEQGGRYNLYCAVLAATLAKKAAHAGIKSIGVISPYSVHARLIKMILDESEDGKLKHLGASTVHRFQGLEQDVIIFDVAEGPMPGFGPSSLVDGVDLASDAAKLINVAITRPKAQIALVANVSYLTSRLRPRAILRRVIEHFQARGVVIDSRQVVDEYTCSDFERWSRLLEPRYDGVVPEAGNLYTERNFYPAFFADLRQAKKEIVIVSPFLSANRASKFFDLFREKLSRGVAIRVFTQPAARQAGPMADQAALVIDEMRHIGIQVFQTTNRNNIHQKFAFIDREVAWEGSLNILSRSQRISPDPEEHMRRLPFPRACAELIELHRFGTDEEVSPGSRSPIQTDLRCPNPKCGGVRMIIKRGKYGFFLSCPSYPKCEERRSITRGDHIGTDVACLGKDGHPCGKPMVATRGRFGVYLRCSDPNCKATCKISG